MEASPSASLSPMDETAIEISGGGGDAEGLKSIPLAGVISDLTANSFRSTDRKVFSTIESLDDLDHLNISTETSFGGHLRPLQRPDADCPEPKIDAPAKRPGTDDPDRAIVRTKGKRDGDNNSVTNLERGPSILGLEEGGKADMLKPTAMDCAVNCSTASGSMVGAVRIAESPEGEGDCLPRPIPLVRTCSGEQTELRKELGEKSRPPSPASCTSTTSSSHSCSASASQSTHFEIGRPNDTTSFISGQSPTLSGTNTTSISQYADRSSPSRESASADENEKNGEPEESLEINPSRLPPLVTPSPLRDVCMAAAMTASQLPDIKIVLRKLITPQQEDHVPSEADLQFLENPCVDLRQGSPYAPSDSTTGSGDCTSTSNIEVSIAHPDSEVSEQMSVVVSSEVGEGRQHIEGKYTGAYTVPLAKPRMGRGRNSHGNGPSTRTDVRVQEPRRIMLHRMAKDDSVLIIGKCSTDPGVMTVPIMEGIRECLPTSVAGANFWLKFSSDQERGTLPELLPKIQHSSYTIIGVETTQGDLFGAFCSSPWRTNSEWFGSKEAFLWKLKKSRHGGAKRQFNLDNELEIYPCVGSEDDHVQYCTEKTLAVGGGSDTKRTDPGFMLDGDLMGGETCSCSTFANPKLCGDNATEFEIATLEVWALTPYSTVDDCEELEKFTRNLFKGTS